MSDINLETSKYSMSDFYKVLKWIPRSVVDRQEPVNLNEIVFDTDHIVCPTIYEEFNGIDEVLVFINFNGVNVDVNDILLDFSPLVNGNLSLFQAKCDSKDLVYDTDTILLFKLDKNVRFSDETRVLTGIQSMKLSFNTDITDVKITKILFKSQNYTYTLSDIENFLITGENHVLGKLGRYSKGIPKELMQYVYMAGGAYAWLSRWEYEAKPMKEAKAEADNYATRLLNQVNGAIAEYIANEENKLDHDDLFHATARGIDWGL